MREAQKNAFYGLATLFTDYVCGSPLLIAKKLLEKSILAWKKLNDRKILLFRQVLIWLFQVGFQY